MQLIRGCLMTQGLVMLLMITSCVVGVSGCSRSLNPTEYRQSVEETPDKTRRMIRDFLEGATYESPDKIAVRGKPTVVKVQDYSDGSIHLTASQANTPLLDIAIVLTPREENRTRIEVVADGDRLADEMDGAGAGALHRAIKDNLESAFSAIDAHRVVPRGFLLSRIIAQARGDDR